MAILHVGEQGVAKLIAPGSMVAESPEGEAPVDNNNEKCEKTNEYQ